MATLKNTLINDTGFCQWPVGTTAERPVAPAEGYVRINTSTKFVESYLNASWFSAVNVGYIDATGGTITTSGNYKIHTFTASGALVVNSAPYNATLEVFMVGAGGSGASYSGGGAGGEVIYCAAMTIVPGNYSIVVGAGGVDTGSGWTGVASPGSPTTAFGETAKPGGGGRGSDSTAVPASNEYANGGGGGSRTAGYGGTTGTNVYNTFTRYGGYTGGSGKDGVNYPTGGGAGAGGNGGSPANSSSSGGDGGVGVQNAILGTNYYWAGGGGGMIYYYQSAGTYGGNGGAGGGGGGWGDSSRFGSGGAGLNNGGNASGFNGGNGGANTGGGGGAGAGNNAPSPYTTGGSGGSGIVVIKYLYQ